MATVKTVRTIHVGPPTRRAGKRNAQPADPAPGRKGAPAAAAATEAASEAAAATTAKAAGEATGKTAVARPKPGRKAKPAPRTAAQSAEPAPEITTAATGIEAGTETGAKSGTDRRKKAKQPGKSAKPAKSGKAEKSHKPASSDPASNPSFTATGTRTAPAGPGATSPGETAPIPNQTTEALDMTQDNSSSDKVSFQVSDAVSQVNVGTVGVGPAYASLQTMLAQSQAQSVLMANMVSNQRQLAMGGMATLTKSIEQLMNRHNR